MRWSRLDLGNDNLDLKTWNLVIWHDGTVALLDGPGELRLDEWLGQDWDERLEVATEDLVDEGSGEGDGTRDEVACGGHLLASEHAVHTNEVLGGTPAGAVSRNIAEEEVNAVRATKTHALGDNVGSPLPLAAKRRKKVWDVAWQVEVWDRAWKRAIAWDADAWKTWNADAWEATIVVITWLAGWAWVWNIITWTA